MIAAGGQLGLMTKPMNHEYGLRMNKVGVDPEAVFRKKRADVKIVLGGHMRVKGEPVHNQPEKYSPILLERFHTPEKLKIFLSP